MIVRRYRTIEGSRERIRGLAVSLSNLILKHKEEFDEDMRKEIIEYLKEKLWQY